MSRAKATPDLSEIKDAVHIAQEQAIIAQMFHDTWLPTVQDAQAPRPS